MKKLFLYFSAIFFLFTSTTIAQNIDKTVKLDSTENISIIVNQETDLISTQNIEEKLQEYKGIKVSDNTKNLIIPSQGFSLNSLLRGVIGMLTLVFIAFLFSNNKKASCTNFKSSFCKSHF